MSEVTKKREKVTTPEAKCGSSGGLLICENCNKMRRIATAVSNRNNLIYFKFQILHIKPNLNKIVISFNSPVLSSRPGYTWAWCRQRRGAWLCPRRRWGWSRRSRSAAPWGTCPLAGLLVCLLWGCCRQHRGWACHHPGRGECSCQVLGVIDLTHWSFTSCVARYIFLIKYFFNAQ